MSDRSRSLLEHLTELEQAATPGPWSVDSDYFVGQVPSGRPGGEVIGRCYPTAGSLRGMTPDRENAALIVALRNAAPAILSVLEAAEKLCHFLEEEKLTTAPPDELLSINCVACESAADYDREERLSLALREALAGLGHEKEEKNASR